MNVGLLTAAAELASPVSGAGTCGGMADRIEAL